jgi:dTDP-glucose pyrophosphorylase
VLGYVVKDRKELDVELDPSARILSFEEKPQEPKSSLGVPALYIYKQETLPLIKKYLQEGNNPDAPGCNGPHCQDTSFRFLNYTG